MAPGACGDAGRCCVGSGGGTYTSSPRPLGAAVGRLGPPEQRHAGGWGPPDLDEHGLSARWGLWEGRSS